MKLIVIAFAILMATTGVAVANLPGLSGPADSSYGPTTHDTGDIGIGPDNGNNCQAGQALGYGGTPTGSGALGDGSTGYHRYANDQGAIGLLDACLGLAGVQPFVGCAIANERDNFSADVISNIGNPSAALNALITDEGNLAGGATCGGILGTGSDGEFEYGSDMAALNVDASRLNNQPGGHCIGDALTAATAHHADDSAVGVWDAALGGAVGFTVGADFSRPGSTSSDGTDHNTGPGTGPFCGDLVLEPCTTGAHPGFVDDLRRPASSPPSGVGGVVSEAGGILLPTSNSNIGTDEDIAFGCNPLDIVQHYAANMTFGAGSNPLTGSIGPTATSGNYRGIARTSQCPSPVTVNLSNCYDGAAGWALVVVDPTGIRVDVDRQTAFPAASTFGWIWSGTDGVDLSDAVAFQPECTGGGAAGHSAWLCAGWWDAGNTGNADQSPDAPDCSGVFISTHNTAPAGSEQDPQTDPADLGSIQECDSFV